MSSSNLRALLVRCLGASNNNGLVGLATFMLSAAPTRGLSTSLEAPLTCHKHFNSISRGCSRASEKTRNSPPHHQQQQQQQQQQWQQLTVCSRRQLPQLLPPSSKWPSATATAGCMQQQQLQLQHALLPRLLRTSAAAWKRVSIPDPEDEMEVLLDEDEDVELDENDLEDEQLDDPEWVADGELATTRHASGFSRHADRSNSYNNDDDDDDIGEYDVEFDEAWEDEEEVDDLRDNEDAGGVSQRR